MALGMDHLQHAEVKLHLKSPPNWHMQIPPTKNVGVIFYNGYCELGCRYWYEGTLSGCTLIVPLAVLRLAVASMLLRYETFEAGREESGCVGNSFTHREDQFCSNIYW